MQKAPINEAFFIIIIKFLFYLSVSITLLEACNRYGIPS